MNSANLRKTNDPNSKTINPIIIAHNCGYEGYGEKCYSLEATKKAYRDCDYLEIDLILKKNLSEEKWWYFHDGIYGGEDREKGISFDQFLKDFKDAADAAIEMKLRPDKPGIFLDLKEHLNQEKVSKLMNYLDSKARALVL